MQAGRTRGACVHGRDGEASERVRTRAEAARGRMHTRKEGHAAEHCRTRGSLNALAVSSAAARTVRVLSCLYSEQQPLRALAAVPVSLAAKLLDAAGWGGRIWQDRTGGARGRVMGRA